MELLRIDFDLWRLLIFLSIIKIFNFIFRNKTVLYCNISRSISEYTIRFSDITRLYFDG